MLFCVVLYVRLCKTLHMVKHVRAGLQCWLEPEARQERRERVDEAEAVAAAPSRSNTLHGRPRIQRGQSHRGSVINMQ